jgi:hypothetical protein
MTGNVFYVTTIHQQFSYWLSALLLRDIQVQRQVIDIELRDTWVQMESFNSSGMPYYVSPISTAKIPLSPSL